MKNLKFILFALSIIGFTYSCTNLGDDTEELELQHAEAMAKFKAEYNITEADSIGDGIYLKIITPVGPGDTVFSNGKDQVVVDLLGFDADGNPFDVTDAEVAKDLDVYRADYIYGPLRVNVQNIFIGFYKAIQKIPEGAEAIILFPHDQAFGGYTPILYKVKLYRVIHDLDSYIEKEFTEYRDKLGMTADDTLAVPGYEGILYKSLEEGDRMNELQYGDSVKIQIRARYVEIDSAYVDSFPGREFFPINNSGDIHKFIYGESYFPVTEAVHVAISEMKVGDKWEILAPANFVYGEEGFRHPTMGTIIVPSEMPVHYTIKLLSDYH